MTRLADLLFCAALSPVCALACWQCLGAGEPFLAALAAFVSGALAACAALLYIVPRALAEKRPLEIDRAVRRANRRVA